MLPVNGQLSGNRYLWYIPAMSNQTFQPATLESLARAHAPEALGTVLDIMRDAPQAELRMRAAQIILDRGHGKPTQAVITLPMTPKAAARLYNMSDDELLELAADARGKMQKAEGGVPPERGTQGGGPVAVEPLPHAISPTPNAIGTGTFPKAVTAGDMLNALRKVPSGTKHTDVVDAEFDELDIAQ